MRHRPTTAVLFALAATLACGTIASAAKPTSRPARDPEKAFKRIDIDHDGLISKTEFDAVAKRLAERREKPGKGGKGGANAEAGARLFEKLDADKDGFLSPEEFAKLQDVRRDAGGRGATTRPARHGRATT
jgi:hypothetical protein